MLTWLPPLIVFTFMRSAVASPFHVPTGSMVPSIEVGDRILVSKLAYGLNVPWVDLGVGLSAGTFTTWEALTWADPARGHVVLFRSPSSPGVDFVKRVVGVPGDVVAVRDGVVHVNGEAQARNWLGPHDFVDQECRTWPAGSYLEELGGVEHAVLDSLWRDSPDFGPVTVPEGSLFVMGDNRDHSMDSRYWGVVPRENVRGRVVGVWMHTDRAGGVDCAGTAQMGWRPL